MQGQPSSRRTCPSTARHVRLVLSPPTWAAVRKKMCATTLRLPPVRVEVGICRPSSPSAAGKMMTQVASIPTWEGRAWIFPSSPYTNFTSKPEKTKPSACLPGRGGGRRRGGGRWQHRVRGSTRFWEWVSGCQACPAHHLRQWRTIDELEGRAGWHHGAARWALDHSHGKVDAGAEGEVEQADLVAVWEARTLWQVGGRQLLEGLVAGVRMLQTAGERVFREQLAAAGGRRRRRWAGGGGYSTDGNGGSTISFQPSLSPTCAVKVLSTSS